MEFPFQPRFKPHHSVHRADPAAVESTKEQARNRTTQEDYHPDLDSAFGQQDQEQGEKHELQGSLDSLNHAFFHLCQSSWD